MEWNEKRINVSSDQILTLANIGATEADPYGNRRGKIKIPAYVVNKSGKTVDPCLIQISKEPPIIFEEKPIIFGENVQQF